MTLVELLYLLFWPYSEYVALGVLVAAFWLFERFMAGWGGPLRWTFPVLGCALIAVLALWSLGFWETYLVEAFAEP